MNKSIWHNDFIRAEPFHHHQASIHHYRLKDGNIIKVFYSYATPQVITLINYKGGYTKSIILDKKFSSTTTRQVNRYIKEHNIQAEKRSVDGFYSLVKAMQIAEGRLTW